MKRKKRVLEYIITLLIELLEFLLCEVIDSRQEEVKFFKISSELTDLMESIFAEEAEEMV